MAIRCNTALVEPPKAMTTVIAFSNAFLVMISRGRILFLIMLSTAAPAGGSGDDIELDGGQGVDRVNGGTGEDNIFGGDGDDVSTNSSPGFGSCATTGGLFGDD